MILCATCLDPIDDDHPGMDFRIHAGELDWPDSWVTPNVPIVVTLHNDGTCRLDWMVKYEPKSFVIMGRIG
jgi:hypothetical protein